MWIKNRYSVLVFLSLWYIQACLWELLGHYARFPLTFWVSEGGRRLDRNEASAHLGSGGAGGGWTSPEPLVPILAYLWCWPLIPRLGQWPSHLPTLLTKAAPHLRLPATPAPFQNAVFQNWLCAWNENLHFHFLDFFQDVLKKKRIRWSAFKRYCTLH